MIPSTAGTGADVSQFCIITDTASAVKVTIMGRALVPDISVTDPGLLTTMPDELAAATGLPLSGVIGLRFALEPGRERTLGVARSVLIGAVVALTTVVATLTFGSGLNTLVTHPSLYGWNWDYALVQVGGGQVPPFDQRLLDRSPVVASWTGFN